jgi:hypothetical protein
VAGGIGGLDADLVRHGIVSGAMSPPTKNRIDPTASRRPIDPSA